MYIFIVGIVDGFNNKGDFTMGGTIKKYFGGSLVFTIASMIVGGIYGYSIGGISSSLTTIFLIMVLGVLETSLSFDNAVVNAKILVTMSDVWKHRFLTWGMIIAVFGMRIVFPLLIVSLFSHINIIDALKLGLFDQEKYAETLKQSHIMVAGFGGAFLLLVGVSYFFDAEKENHWIKGIEPLLSNAGNIKSIEIITTLITLIAVNFTIVPAHERLSFIISALAGIILHEVIVGISDALESHEAKQVTNVAIKGGVMSFIYLEIMDSSFSFDGVIGALAITNNFIIIALGLGIGAMFVRSLTILLVDKGTMSEYIYLEHGAFWSIIVLSGIMFASISYEVPEIVTGLLSVGFIGSAIVSSINHNKKAKVS